MPCCLLMDCSCRKWIPPPTGGRSQCRPPLRVPSAEAALAQGVGRATATATAMAGVMPMSLGLVETRRHQVQTRRPHRIRLRSCPPAERA
eukprot:scaffold2910_cov390-Prasinococcus_capsulatus_cf.AAC.11